MLFLIRESLWYFFICIHTCKNNWIPVSIIVFLFCVCVVQLLISPICNPISSFIMQNRSYACCMLKLGLFAIFWSFEGYYKNLPLYVSSPTWKKEFCSCPLERARARERSRGLDPPNSSNINWNSWEIWSLPILVGSHLLHSYSGLLTATRGFHVNVGVYSWFGSFSCYLCWLSHHLACYWSISQVVACMDKLAWGICMFFGMLIWDDGDWCFSELAAASILLLNHWAICGLVVSNIGAVFIPVHRVFGEMFVRS